MIRSQTLTLRSRAYVKAARISGSSDLKIIVRHIVRHIVPNILPLPFLYGSIAIGWAILTEASISFLGFGDPTSISWGYMLQYAYASQALSSGPTTGSSPPPGICIILIVSADFFISRGYEKVLLPKLER